nr:hypothetical protein [Tanacetum cinerariifolium]
MNVQHGYLNHLKDTLDTLCEIIEEARSNRTFDNSLEYACVYTKTSQEFLENVIASCPKTVNKGDGYNATTHAKRNKNVTFAEPLEIHPTTHLHMSQPRRNTKIDRTLPAKSGHTNNIEAHLRNNKSDLHKKNHVDSGIGFKLQASDLNVNKMASADNSSGPAPQRKERCTLQCALSLKEDKSSYLRAVLSTTSRSYHARSVNNSGPTPNFLTPRYISSGLVQNSVSPTPYVPPSKKDYKILFQQLFDDYFNPLPRAISPVSAVVAALRVVDPAGDDEQIHRHQNALFDNAPLLHNLSSNPSSEEKTLQGFISSNLHHLNQSFDTLTKLTMNHPLENVICDPSRSVLTRSQLQGHAIWCYFDANDNPIPLVGKGVVEIYYLKGRIMVIFGLYTSSLLNAAFKKALNLLKKGLLIWGEAVESSKRRRSLLDHKIQLLSKGLSEGSEVIEKQAENVQISLTLSYAKVEIQSMVDVPIHQEDPAV